MPKGTKVARCVEDVQQRQHKQKGNAIAICQKSTGLSYATGKPPKGKSKGKQK